MLQRLPIALAQVKGGNTSENLLNEIRQIICSLYRAKQITKKSISQYNEFIKVDTIFVNYKSSETSDLHGLLLNLTDKIYVKRRDKYVALSNLSIYYTQKNIESHIRTINSRYQLQHEMKSLSYLMDHILC